jgi:hypothetical protein
MSVFRQKRKRVDTAAMDSPTTSCPDVAAVTIDEDDDAAADTTFSVAADDTTSSVTDNQITPSTIRSITHVNITTNYLLCSLW